MKIKQITNQHRRDFSAIMKCEFCQKETKLNSGYDDRYYHDNVIPNMKCSKCLKSTLSKDGKITKTATKYSANQIV